MTFIIIYVTHANEEQAKKVSEAIINKKLVACVNTFGVKSTFFWNDKINSENEIVTIYKTRKENWEKRSNTEIG